jgi:hypothetical protein
LKITISHGGTAITAKKLKKLKKSLAFFLAVSAVLAVVNFLKN